MLKEKGLVSLLVFSAILCGAGLRGAAFGADEKLPIARLAQVTFLGADLAQTRQFYGEVMGFEEVSRSKDAADQPTGVVFKVNDDQFLAFFAGGTKDNTLRMDKVSFLTPEIRAAQEKLRARQLAPGEIRKEADGNPHFSFADPDGTTIDFVEYVPGSFQAGLRGKALGPRRVVTHLQHAGFAAQKEDASLPFFRDKLGFWEIARGGPMPGETRWIVLMMPGTQGDFVELMVYAKEPPERRQHICFGVPDIQPVHKLLIERGLPPPFNPFRAKNGLMFMNVRDPNGMRVEFMEVKDVKNNPFPQNPAAGS